MSKSRFIIALKSRLPFGALLLFLSLTTMLMVGDLRVRLANITTDDNPVFYSMYWQNPGRFEGDIAATYSHATALSTLQNWLPALLQQTAGLPPIIPSWIFVFMQGVLLGLAMFRYTRLVTGRTDIAWLTVLFTYAAQAWGWNLANYGDHILIPYAGQLVLPFLLFAAAEVLRERLFRTAIFLILAGLIHPALTLQMLVILGIHWLPLRPAKERKRLFTQLLVLGIVAGVCIIPALYLQSHGIDPLSAAELMPALKRNLHMSPWTEPAIWSVSLSTFVGFLLLTVMAFAHRRAMVSSWLAFWRSSLIGTMLLAVLHLVGWFGEIPKLIQLVPLRATLLFVLFSLPLVMLYLSEKLKSKQFMTRWATALVLLSLAVFASGLLWGPLAALLFHELSVVKLRAGYRPALTRWIRRLGHVVLVAWTGLILFAAGSALLHASTIPYSAILSALIPGVRITFRSYFFLFFIVATSALLGTIGYTANRVLASLKRSTNFIEANSFPVMILAVLLASIVVFKSWEMGAAATTQPTIISNYMSRLSSVFGRSWQRDNQWYNGNFMAQVWARDNTPEDAVFITYRLPWRTISQRRSVDPRVSQTYIYAGSRQGKRFDDEYLAFYGFDQSFQKMSFDELIRAENAAYSKLDEAGILRLAHQFGGDYIVRSITEPLKFPEVYRNDQFVIYKLTASR